MTGSHSLYSAEIAERILQQLSNGRMLNDICDDPGMPSRGTVQNWVTADRQNFAARYRQARNTDKTRRPSLYTAEIAERILQQFSHRRRLNDICSDPGMPAARTVWQWLKDKPEDFAARYRRARKAGRGGGGGPTVYTAEIAERILDQLSDGRTLANVCRDPGMPVSSTVRNWADEDREGFAARYRRAREIGYHIMADEILAIADDDSNDWSLRRRRDGETEVVLHPESVARARLRCLSRAWLLSKALPRNYGNRPNLMARLEARDTLAEVMKEIEDRNRAPAKHDPAGKKSGSE
jgi:hypothetical protein